MKINVNLYGGKGLFGGKETPLEADIISCDCAESCTFYKNSTCLKCRAFLQPSCIFGSVRTVRGYTSRASKYYEFRETYTKDEAYNKLKYPTSNIAIMRDTLYMNLRYTLVRKETDDNKNSSGRRFNGYILSEVGFCRGDVFLPLSDVTAELLNAIFSYTPRAMTGGAITDYKDKIVPDIIQSMRKVAPELHSKLIKDYPKYDVAPNYIGKEVYINSLKPNTIFNYNNKEWMFDGEYLSTDNFDIGLGSPWWSQGGKYSAVKIRVTDKMTFKVEDNSIVDEDTRFV